MFNYMKHMFSPNLSKAFNCTLKLDCAGTRYFDFLIFSQIFELFQLGSKAKNTQIQDVNFLIKTLKNLNK